MEFPSGSEPQYLSRTESLRKLCIILDDIGRYTAPIVSWQLDSLGYQNQFTHYQGLSITLISVKMVLLTK